MFQWGGGGGGGGGGGVHRRKIQNGRQIEEAFEVKPLVARNGYSLIPEINPLSLFKLPCFELLARETI